MVPGERPRPPVAADARPVRDPRLGGDAPADAGRARVVPRYLAWLERWPTAGSLAAAPTGRRDPRMAGARLQPARGQSPSRSAGRRARRLARRPDRASRRRPATRPPRCAASPSARTCFPVDVNVERVQRRTGETFSARSAQALMDLGATVCLARIPRCDACPLASACPSRGIREEPARKQGRIRRLVPAASRSCAPARRRRSSRARRARQRRRSVARAGRPRRRRGGSRRASGVGRGRDFSPLRPCSPPRNPRPRTMRRWQPSSSSTTSRSCARSSSAISRARATAHSRPATAMQHVSSSRAPSSISSFSTSCSPARTDSSSAGGSVGDRSFR